ncbi:hypothetical protein ADL21_17320 [Streptomyces albus subsp. albus]|nr:hypothetical protein ADL21_17320 [Streptomyces albus subsp. albus]
MLADQLGGRESLLVVDNCEHLIDAVAHLLAALLARCAQLRVLRPRADCPGNCRSAAPTDTR